MKFRVLRWQQHMLQHNYVGSKTVWTTILVNFYRAFSSELFHILNSLQASRDERKIFMISSDLPEKLCYCNQLLRSANRNCAVAVQTDQQYTLPQQHILQIPADHASAEIRYENH